MCRRRVGWAAAGWWLGIDRVVWREYHRGGGARTIEGVPGGKVWVAALSEQGGASWDAQRMHGDPVKLKWPEGGITDPIYEGGGLLKCASRAPPKHSFCLNTVRGVDHLTVLLVRKDARRYDDRVVYYWPQNIWTWAIWLEQVVNH